MVQDTGVRVRKPPTGVSKNRNDKRTKEEREKDEVITKQLAEVKEQSSMYGILTFYFGFIGLVVALGLIVFKIVYPTKHFEYFLGGCVIEGGFILGLVITAVIKGNYTNKELELEGELTKQDKEEDMKRGGK